MKTATGAGQTEGSTVLDAREVSQQIIERLTVGHGRKTWGGQGRFEHSGETFRVVDARFGSCRCDTFKLFVDGKGGKCECRWKANVNDMRAYKLPHGVLLVDGLNECPPVVLTM